MKNSIYILGIDPGFDRLGVAILEKKQGEEKLIFSTCVITNKKESFEERLFQIGNDLEKIIKKHKPNHLSIEKLFLTSNQRTVMHVSEARGVCVYIAKKYNLKIFEYSPPEIKLAVTGYGKSDKNAVSLMVSRILKIKTSTKMIDDEFDAIAVALTHSAINKNKL